MTITRRQAVARMNTHLFIAHVRDHALLSSAFATDLRTTFDWFGNACAAMFTDLSARGTSQALGSTLVKTLDARKIAEQIVSTLSDPMAGKLEGTYRKNYQRILGQTVNTINNVTNLGVGVSDPAQRRILETGGKRAGLIDIEKSAHTAIFNAINEGNQAGMNPRDIARTIRSDVPAGRFVNSGSGYRAQLVARTETNWAQNLSSITAYRESDVVSSVTAMDGDSDEECAARDGQEFSFDDAETEMENEHPNGTLAFAPSVTSDFSPPSEGAPDIEAQDLASDLVALATPETAGRTLDGMAIKNIKECEKQISKAIENISGVHEEPKRAFAVQARTSLDMKASLRGVFQWTTEAQPQVKVNSRLGDGQARATTYHELGHWLDFSTKSGRTTYASESRVSPYKDVMAAIERSEKSPAKLRADASLGSADYRTYLATPREMFARAYSQYMATAANDEAAQIILEAQRTQWAAKDFEKIHEAFDKNLKELGLRGEKPLPLPERPAPIPRAPSVPRTPPARAPVRPIRPARPARPAAGARRLSSTVHVAGGGSNIDRMRQVREAVKKVSTVHNLPSHAENVRVSLKLPKDTPAGIFGTYEPRGAISIGRADPIVTRVSTYQQLGRYTDFQLGKGEFASARSSGPIRDIVETLKAANRISGRYSPEYFNQLMQDNEIFSRGYAQYVATKLGDTEALSMLRSADTQWSANAFEELMPLFDSLFSSEGLLL